MEPEIFVDILSDALFLVIKLVSAIVVPGLIVGLVVAVFQAATSINEQTLSFLPRLLITISALIVGGHWLTQELMDFFTRLVLLIPEIAG
ncbi:MULTISPECIES: flagellar biosynthesis protein FliQ [Pseudoalteromonas]|jgi:flagellar biosynthesis protein FliQ|uniref:Flagellar biosynthetic protein FliQ n=1 Tax=Pseudoalteromonas carrageenovora IAM 12662 TaxID=1314868 RepID=A0A2K4XBH5_PSEVC|nr:MULTISPECIES: flagellar biosynthesis protein FliQ [Pseudoalteromonas]KTF12786.1 flagellar biosynthetic protein FliQ [Pseudoalteromonas sp. H103]MBE0383691.1 flagellar biosynthetic protein FliQ [Pseudoalteromonas carrageenovora IAM 12662]MBQ4797814.1 flagellar biosynthesis protein FliQ [Pseudoalteromonas sp. MMG006]MBQ4857094.1 flagellar biosynthesis protein FliQ [Pseudoalteromonas sp. MMG007]MCQ8889067.1 flagellar biosynthesis protein FliQ [Pseudoalteromonas carrageenovora]|tara:strand:+ start:774 stop:1043 length:270 start_codon:yes stop_codon:yes gene_type:complete